METEEGQGTTRYGTTASGQSETTSLRERSQTEESERREGWHSGSSSQTIDTQREITETSEKSKTTDQRHAIGKIGGKRGANFFF